MARDNRRIKLALHLAQLSPHKFQMAAIIFKGSTLLNMGTNRTHGHPKQANHYTGKSASSIHAELDAILRVKSSKLKGATIYIARRLKNGKAGIARPCSCCRKTIKAAKIKKIIYTTSTGFEVEKVR